MWNYRRVLRLSFQEHPMGLCSAFNIHGSWWLQSLLCQLCLRTYRIAEAVAPRSSTQKLSTVRMTLIIHTTKRWKPNQLQIASIHFNFRIHLIWKWHLIISASSMSWRSSWYCATRIQKSSSSEWLKNHMGPTAGPPHAGPAMSKYTLFIDRFVVDSPNFPLKHPFTIIYRDSFPPSPMIFPWNSAF